MWNITCRGATVTLDRCATAQSRCGEAGTVWGYLGAGARGGADALQLGGLEGRADGAAPVPEVEHRGEHGRQAQRAADLQPRHGHPRRQHRRLARGVLHRLGARLVGGCPGDGAAVDVGVGELAQHDAGAVLLGGRDELLRREHRQRVHRLRVRSRDVMAQWGPWGWGGAQTLRSALARLSSGSFAARSSHASHCSGSRSRHLSGRKPLSVSWYVARTALTSECAVSARRCWSRKMQVTTAQTKSVMRPASSPRSPPALIVSASSLTPTKRQPATAQRTALERATPRPSPKGIDEVGWRRLQEATALRAGASSPGAAA